VAQPRENCTQSAILRWWFAERRVLCHVSDVGKKAMARAD
jgi:hypothetical protein